MSSPRSTQAMADYLVDDMDGGTWISPAGYPPSRRRLVDMVEEYRGEPERIADVGCGAGELSAGLGEAYDASIVAVDISPASCQATRERTAPYGNVDVLCADANRAPLQDGAFDIIFAANSLQDTEDPAQTLDNLYTWLRDGGDLVVTVPGEEGMRQMPDPWFHEEELDAGDGTVDIPYMHPETERLSMAGDGEVPSELGDWGQYVFPRDTARKLFEEAGFTIEEEDALTADATGIVSVGRMLGDRRMKWSGWVLDKVQRLYDGVGPGVDMYRLRK